MNDVIYGLLQDLQTSFNCVKSSASSRREPSLSQAELVANLNLWFPDIHWKLCPEIQSVHGIHDRVLNQLQKENSVNKAARETRE